MESNRLSNKNVHHLMLSINLTSCFLSVAVSISLCWPIVSVFSSVRFSSRLPLYKAIFSSFRRCYTERKVPVLLPGVMLKGQAQVQVTLHHHICVQLCASVAVLPPAFFPVLVCSSHTITSFRLYAIFVELHLFFILISRFYSKSKGI